MYIYIRICIFLKTHACMHGNICDTDSNDENANVCTNSCNIIYLLLLLLSG